MEVTALVFSLDIKIYVVIDENIAYIKVGTEDECGHFQCRQKTPEN